MVTSHLAAALLAVDPVGLGGAVWRGTVGPERDAWLAELRALLPPGTPWRRMPPQVAEGRLLGGLDLAATLAAGRPVAEPGLLAQADGGLIIVPMAERLAAGSATYLAAAVDTGEVVVERDGIALRRPARIAAVLLDEGVDDERVPAVLMERVAFLSSSARNAGEGERSKIAGGSNRSQHSGMGGSEAPLTGHEAPLPRFTGEDIAAARERLADIAAGDDVVAALAAAGLAFGVPSLRLAVLALRAARAAAALAGRTSIAEGDVEIAAALVIAPRATCLPAAEPDEKTEPEAPPSEPEPASDDAPCDETDAQTLEERVLEATRAAIPAALLSVLSAAAAAPRQSTGGGRAGVARKSMKRGRPAGVRRGAPGHGARLAIVETLRAAAPWQRLRRAASPSGQESRILVRREDFRVGRFKEKSETLTIFAVDASGSAALHRLAEVKGAVELILAECYVRRDCVALIAFRGDRAELVLPPTRSLARAKRALAGQPGGGGTPLAAAIDAASLLAQAACKRGQTPLVVLLTDGKANISRAGRPGRAEAEADASAAAKAFHFAGTSALLLDIAPRPGPAAARLAAEMGARYIPLPYADAQRVSHAVLASTTPTR